LNLFDIRRFEVCVFGFGMLDGLKYENYAVFLYLSEYQHITHFTYRRIKKWAPKPKLLGGESLGLTR